MYRRTMASRRSMDGRRTRAFPRASKGQLPAAKHRQHAGALTAPSLSFGIDVDWNAVHERSTRRSAIRVTAVGFGG